MSGKGSRKMKRKILLGIILMSLLFIGGNVNAEEIYYINNNNLSFTKFQYEAMKELFGEEYLQNFTKEEYDNFEVATINEDNYKVKIYDEEEDENRVSNYATFIETSYKRLSISSICNTNYCTVTVMNTWKASPSVRSYDVIGVRLSATNFYDNTITANLVISGTSYGRSGMNGSSQGVGCVMKLRSGDVDYIMHKVRVKPKGTVFASYQHAVKSITLTKALDFTFSGGGLGGVFSYPSSYGTMYDQMSGVYLNL